MTHPETQRHLDTVADVIGELRAHTNLVDLLSPGTDSIRPQETTDTVVEGYDTQVLVDVVGMQSEATSAVNSGADYQVQVLVTWTKEWHETSSYGTTWRYRVLDALNGALGDGKVAGLIPLGQADSVGPVWSDERNRHVFDVTFEFRA